MKKKEWCTSLESSRVDEIKVKVV